MHTTNLKYRLKTVLAATLLLAAFSLSACVIIINQPSAEEKELMAIQDTVGTQMADIGKKVASGAANPQELGDYIALAQNTVSQAIQRINELKIPEKTKKFADDTVKYLESAKNILNQIKTTLSDLEKLKAQGQELTSQANAAIQEQINSARSAIGGLKSELDKLSGQIRSVRDQIQELYKK
jgi:chromosome segregation ATPase